MKAVITTEIDLETFEPTHSVDVDVRSATGCTPDVVYSAVIGALRSAQIAVEKTREEAKADNV